jgi:Spy/CpxP family protein refolding chaperone
MTVKLWIPWTLFGTSLIVNAFLLGAVAFGDHGKSWGRGGDAAMERVVEKLDLDGTQAAALRDLRSEIAGKAQQMRDGGKESRKALFAELGKETFDEERFLSLMAERGAERRAFMVDAARSLHGFMRGLSDDQRQKFREMIENRRFRRAFMMGARERR